MRRDSSSSAIRFEMKPATYPARTEAIRSANSISFTRLRSTSYSSISRLQQSLHEVRICNRCAEETRIHSEKNSDLTRRRGDAEFGVNVIQKGRPRCCPKANR